MEFLVSLLLYLTGACFIGVGAAWATRQLAGGTGIAWHSDGWPRGIQEEEPRSDWGASFRTPEALAREAVEAARDGVVDDLPEDDSPGVPLQPVRR